MAVFLAVISTSREPLQSHLAESVAGVLARAGSVQLQTGRSAAVAYVDLGLWPGRSVLLDGRTISIIAGDPLIRQTTGCINRENSIGRLSGHGAAVQNDILQAADGTYCGLVLDLHSDTLAAFTDKLGVRPVYYARVGDLVFVSSALWILEGLPAVPKTPDWHAATEVAAFGYPLRDKTLFKDIRVLGAAEVITVDSGQVRIDRYWDWSSIAGKGPQNRVSMGCVRQSFEQAVDDRLGGQQSVLAFLSGGMDSRLIVSRLRERGTRVFTLNFAPEGSQDLELGRLAANALGTEHFEFGEGSATFAERQVQALCAWRQKYERHEWPGRPNLIWSGDGGSVGLGHVYLDQEIVDTSRSAGLAAAAKVIQRNNRLSVSRRMFNAGTRQLANIPLRGIVDDLGSRPDVEPGRNCHLFFMLNDQRRHLSRHFETVHLTNTDLVLPFFDGRFLSKILSSDIQPFLLHGLYNDLMESLPFGAGKVPWQAYPGHLACPVPFTGSSRRQWEDGWNDPEELRREARRRYIGTLRRVMSFKFPSDVLSRSFLTMACVAGVVGLHRYAYLVDAMGAFEGASRHRARN